MSDKSREVKISGPVIGHIISEARKQRRQELVDRVNALLSEKK